MNLKLHFFWIAAHTTMKKCRVNGKPAGCRLVCPLTDAVGHFDWLGLAEHGHATVALLVLGASPVLVWILGHGGDIGRKSFLCAFGLLQAQNVWSLLTHPLEGRNTGRTTSYRC